MFCSWSREWNDIFSRFFILLCFIHSHYDYYYHNNDSTPWARGEQQAEVARGAVGRGEWNKARMRSGSGGGEEGEE